MRYYYKIDDNKYCVKIKEYGYEMFKCLVFKKFLFRYKKVYEKIYMRQLTGNDAKQMAINSIIEYEHSKLIV